MQKTLPEGWKNVKIDEISNLINGKAFKPSDWTVTGLPIIRIQNLNDPTKPYNYFNGEVEPKYHVNNGDVLLSWSGTPGTSFGAHIWQGGDAVLNQHIFRVEISEDRLLKKIFVYAVNLRLNDLIHNAHGGVGLSHITKTRLEKIEITLPPLPTQHKIVEILEEADNLRKLRQQADEKMKNLVPSIFIDMFGDPVMNEKRWYIVRLGEILHGIDSGWSPICEQNARSNNSDWAVLTLGAITTCYFKPTENKLLPSHLVIKKQIEVKKGDVLFCRKNTKDLVGACVYVFNTYPKLLMSDTIFRLDYKKDKIWGQYLWSLLIEKNFRKSIQVLASGSAGSMPNISKQKLLNFKIPLPPLSLQQEFAERVEEIEAEKGRQAESKKKLDELFQSLMQRAFAGELMV
ncbi:MAG: hypothetical protein FJ241_06660 [Nitrospira sp.]|nr:hypothetical protein [Nitrospira sp.]